jgi:hypothetical protein
MMAGTAGRVWRNALIFVVPQVLLIVVITYFVMQSAVLAPIARTARWMRDLGSGASRRAPKASREACSIRFRPRRRAWRRASRRRRPAPKPKRACARRPIRCGPRRLRVGMQERLRGTRLIVVSNRR